MSTYKIHNVEPPELPPEGEHVLVFIESGKAFEATRDAHGYLYRSSEGLTRVQSTVIAWTEMPTIDGGAYRVRKLTPVRSPVRGKLALVLVSRGPKCRTGQRGPVAWTIGYWSGTHWAMSGYSSGLENDFIVTAWCDLPEMP